MLNSGVWGRLYVQGHGNIGGVVRVTLDASTAEIPIPHFESPVDAYGRVWPQYLKGLSGATGNLEGYVNSVSQASFPPDAATTPVTDYILSNGFDATIKVFLDRRSNWGYALSVFVTNYRVVVDMENKPIGFTANVRVNGVMPLSGAV